MKSWLKVSGQSVPHLLRGLSAIALLIAVSGPTVAFYRHLDKICHW